MVTGRVQPPCDGVEQAAPRGPGARPHPDPLPPDDPRDEGQAARRIQGEHYQGQHGSRSTLSLFFTPRFDSPRDGVGELCPWTPL